MANSVSPNDFKRRSFVAKRLVEAGARFEEVAGAAAAMAFSDDGAEEKAALEGCGLADLSPLPRFGIKGRGGPEWLAGQGVAIPETVNTALRQEDGSLAARLSPSEILVLGDLRGGERCGALYTSWARARMDDPSAARGYALRRDDSHAWFRLTGANAPEVFAKLCAVDLRPHRFPALSVAQTSVARSSAIVIREDLAADVVGYHLLIDSASARYLWDCLIDAMAEFDGKAVGLRILRQQNAG